MLIDRLVVGLLEENTYILSINNDVIVIDPGSEYDKIKHYINNKKVLGVLVTHRHFDHIGALSNFDNNLVYDKSNLSEGIHAIGNFNFEVIYTPGHKEDAITFYFKDYNAMFTGDFIFKDAIGRTDLPGGNMESMIESLNKIKSYNKDIIIYPGHGDKSTLGKNDLTKYLL